MTTMTTSREVRACLARGYWFELVDPATGNFFGRWLEPWEAARVAEARATLYGEELELCRVERVDETIPPLMRVQYLERP